MLLAVADDRQPPLLRTVRLEVRFEQQLATTQFSAAQKPQQSAPHGQSVSSRFPFFTPQREPQHLPQNRSEEQTHEAHKRQRDQQRYHLPYAGSGRSVPDPVTHEPHPDKER
ncbi:MAG: hypothetical protein IAG10_22445 [Planctomycetaceae bacterium]|nr:hypothetical protein [Planctomycetaceae bacterium]